MSFSFNFDVHAQETDLDNVHENDFHDGKTDNAANPTDNTKPAELVKEAKEHLPPPDLHFLLVDAVSETLQTGTLPPLHFLNETVFEKTASEREDEEKILSRTAEQRSDLISGVYEGGLKVWECTYDLLQLFANNGETFRGKRVLDLGCGAGLLGMLALKRGASHVHFQDYNSTVIEQVTMPNALLNCQEDDVDSDEDKGGKCKGRIQEDNDWKNKTEDKVKQDVKDGQPPSKKRAVDPSENPLLGRCRFFSGDWITFLALVMKEEPSTQYDLILTSETIYNAAYYPALHDTLHTLLAPHGLVYLATKAHYFGVGGGLHLFEKFAEQRGVFSVDHLWDVDEGLQRHVVSLRFKMSKAV